MIRQALPSDANAIAQVHIRSWQDAYRGLMPADYLLGLDATLPNREASWKRSLESGESQVWVAQVDEQVVGWVSVGASRDEDLAGERVGEVMAIYVLATHWQSGIGFALWRTGVEYLEAQGFQRLTLWVLTRNERAIRFYRKAGWVEDAGSARTLVRGDMTLEEVRYGVSLPR